MKTKSCILILIIFFLLWGALEIVSYILIPPEERHLPAQNLLQKGHNQYLADYSQHTGCTFGESVIAHPMLGFVHRKKEFASQRCNKFFHVNNIGLTYDRDLPLKKKKNEFAVMIVGGSVAEMLTNFKNPDGEFLLEKVLNQKFYPPTGEQFTVYGGAMGAWAMPSQVNMLMMYGERIDAAVSIEGYNEAFPLQEGVRLERVPSATYILSFSSPWSARILGLRFLWAYQRLLYKTWLKHSYFLNMLYRMFSGIYEFHIVSEDLRREFSEGNSENLKIQGDEARKWSLESLQRYLETFHQLGLARKIKTASFLQPTRLYGKKLTDEEKLYHEYIDVGVYRNIEKLYLELSSKGFPVKSLTGVFQNEKSAIYSDHIHYKNENGSSRGNELLIEEVTSELGQIWHLKKR